MGIKIARTYQRPERGRQPSLCADARFDLALTAGAFDSALQGCTLDAALIARLAVACAVGGHRMAARRTIGNLDFFHALILPKSAAACGIAGSAVLRVGKDLRMIKHGDLD